MGFRVGGIQDAPAPAIAALSGLLALAGLAGLCGCGYLDLMGSRDRAYLSNREQLDALGRAAGYEVDPDRYRLMKAEIREDSVAFHYRGVEHPGDAAWVLRFSVKSTEQDPGAIGDVYSLVPAVAEDHAGFVLVDDGERSFGRLTVLMARYRFDSPVRDAMGRPLAGRGILATVPVERDGHRVTYHIKLDRHGSARGTSGALAPEDPASETPSPEGSSPEAVSPEDLTVEDLRPFLEPIERG